MHKKIVFDFTFCGRTCISCVYLWVPLELSHVTDRLTDLLIIGNNSLHLMHSMQPKNMERCCQSMTLVCFVHFRAVIYVQYFQFFVSVLFYYLILVAIDCL